MRPSKACILAVSVVALLALSEVDASKTVVKTCKAAADSNKLVSYDFCVSELNKRHGSHDEDASGLAKMATDAGGANAEAAIVDINDRLSHPSEGPSEALEQCIKLYGDVQDAFIRGRAHINDRKYAAAKEQALLAISSAQKCDDLVGKTVAKPSPLRKYSSYTGNIAAVCIAITDLLK